MSTTSRRFTRARRGHPGRPRKNPPTAKVFAVQLSVESISELKRRAVEMGQQAREDHGIDTRYTAQDVLRGIVSHWMAGRKMERAARRLAK